MFFANSLPYEKWQSGDTSVIRGTMDRVPVHRGLLRATEVAPAPLWPPKRAANIS
jgi:hypothetical protein